MAEKSNTAKTSDVSAAIIAACYALIKDSSFKAENKSALVKLAEMLEASESARNALVACEVTESSFLAVRNIKAYARLHKLIQAIATKQFSFLESATRAYLSVEFKHNVGSMTSLNRKEVRSQSFRSEETRPEFAVRGAKSAKTASAQASCNVMSALACIGLIKNAVHSTRNVVEFNPDSYAYKTLAEAFHSQTA